MARDNDFEGLPAWAARVLDLSTESPAGRPLWQDGVLSFGVAKEDPVIAYYESRGGSRFHERTRIPFTMTSLDTPLYHSMLEEILPADPDALVVDVGSGDGRNTLALLRRGCRRVIAVDPVRPSLLKLAEQGREVCHDLDQRLLLVQADARSLPIKDGVAQLVIAIEALCCLNEDHQSGVAQCARILKRRTGRFLLSDRSWEGALLMRLLYGGVAELLRVGNGRYVWDGPDGTQLRTRVFTEDELVEAVTRAGLKTIARKGLSELSIVFGYLRGEKKNLEQEIHRMPEVLDLLGNLSRHGAARRAHVLTAVKR